MRALILLAALGLAFGSAGASAQVYKCGNAFSDKPCGGNAVKLSTGGSGNPGNATGQGSNAIPEYAAVCLNAIRAQFSFPDKEALRINGHSKKWENFEYADKPIVGQKVTLMVNALGAYGAYTGARAYTCHMSEDARRVLRVDGGA